MIYPPIPAPFSCRLVFWRGQATFVAHVTTSYGRMVWRSDTSWARWHWPSRRLRVYGWRTFERGDEPVKP